MGTQAHPTEMLTRHKSPKVYAGHNKEAPEQVVIIFYGFNIMADRYSKQLKERRNTMFIKRFEF